MPATGPTGEQQLAKLIDVRIQEKFDTLANWEKNNPVLLRGEMGFAALNIDNGMDVGNIRVKIGDGKHAWNELGWGALGPTGVNIHMTKEPVEIVEVDGGKKEGTVVYDSIISGPAEVKVGDFVIDHITTESDNMYEAGWDGTIGFYRITQVNDNEKAAIVEPWGDPMIVKGKWGATGPTGANPAMAIKLQNTDYIRSYNLDTKCGWFYGAPGNTVHDKPKNVDSFTLCVYRKGDNQYIHELYDQNNRIWIETYNGTQWTDWKEKAVGIASVSSSFDFTHKESSATNTGTITVTLDDVDGTFNSHTYEVRNGIGITGVELVKPTPVQTTGSIGNTYTLKFHKSAGGNTDEHQFTVYNGNGIAALRAVADDTSDADSGTSKYHLEYKDTDRQEWTTIADSNFNVQNGQGLIKLEVVADDVNTKDSGSTEWTINAYYSDNRDTVKKIGTLTTYNGQGLANIRVSGTQISTADSGTSTYTVYAKYSDKPNEEVSIGTFQVKNGSAGSTPANAKHIENGTDLNTYTYEKAGWYFAGGGNACSNRPSGVDAFGLEVLRSAQGWTVQICYPSNNSTNQMFIRNSNNGAWTAWQEKGVNGINGTNGYTWIPSVDASGTISWTSTQQGPGTTPAAQDIRGPRGYYGYTFVPTVDDNGNISWTKKYVISTDDTSVATKNIKGPRGYNGYTWIPSVNASGELSWNVTQSGSGTAPGNVNLMGPTGPVIVPSLDANGNLSWSIQSQINSAPATQSILGPTGSTVVPSLDASGNLSWTIETTITEPPTPQSILGPTGPVVVPSVDTSGNLSWTIESEVSEAPTSQSILGPTGPTGPEPYTISFDTTSGILTMTKV